MQKKYKYNNIMLLKIELENFFSIKEKVSLDFRAGNINTIQSRNLSHNVIEWNGQRILKSIGLFGPNASGKSNIVKAISFCCRMIFESHLFNENTVFNFQPFKFEGWDKKPSRFFINFVCEGVEYEYSYSLTQNEILEEALYYYPNKRRAKIFVRNGEDFSFAEGAVPRAKDVVINTSRKNLFLSRASSMNRGFAQKLFRYFANTFLLGLVSLSDTHIEDLFEKYKDVVLDALNVCDCDICNIELRKEKAKNISLSINDKVSPVQVQDVEVVKFFTYHKFAPNIAFDMAVEESNGTRQLFGVLLRLLDVVSNGKALMLDEFDISLHTLLADFILDFIHASESSQLLFTSHNTNLIDISRLRKDQILFVNKKDDGSTEVYSLYDFKEFRENMDAEKGYKQGRFDAIPLIDSSVNNLKRLMER